MWLGLLYLTPDETDECHGDETVLLLAWQAGQERPLTIGGPTGAVAHLACLLREVGEQKPILPPRCDACGTPLDLPLD